MIYIEMGNPKVTVLMPVYNGEKYIRDAIESILEQTFTDFEFLIINDGSTDRSVEIIRSYNDSRIRLVHNERNLGLIATLNKGLDLAQGEYIARMDCDDISLPERLRTQVEYMDTHPEIGVCGTKVKAISDKGSLLRRCHVDAGLIKSRLVFGSAIAHPSVILRRDFVEKFSLRYNARFTKAEDYEFWVRCSDHFPLTNINKVLLLYRLHPEQTKRIFKDIQKKTSNEIRFMQIKKLGINPSEEELELHQNLSTFNYQSSEDFLKHVNSWLLKLSHVNKKNNHYPEPSFSEVLSERWFHSCNNATKLGLMTWKIYWQSPLSKGIRLGYNQKVTFFIKCLIRMKRLNFFKNIEGNENNPQLRYNKIDQNSDYIKNLDESIIGEIIDKHTSDMPPKASVVIVTYNNKESLIETLEALKNQTVQNFETLIIDNNNRLKIAEYVVKYKIKYIKLMKNYGLTVGRNVGIKYSKGEIVIFLDDDAIPANNFVEEHIAAHEMYDIFGLRGKSLPKTNSIYNYLAPHYDLGDLVINYHINLEGNSSFKKNILIEIGGFNPKLQGAGGGEGLELTFRAILKYKDKNKFIYYPRAIIYHDFCNTFAKYIKKQLRHAKHRKILMSEFPEIFLLSQEYTSKVKGNSSILLEQIIQKIIKLSVKTIVNFLNLIKQLD